MTETHIKLDKKTFEALASDMRIRILKQLKLRPMTTTELSEILNISKSTANGHLNKFMDVNLVRRRNEGRKGVYYELTEMGRVILHTKQIRVRIILSIALFSVIGGIVQMCLFIIELSQIPTLYTTHPPKILYLLLAIQNPQFLLGIVLILIGIIFSVLCRKYKYFL